MRRDSRRLDELLHEWQVVMNQAGRPPRLLTHQFLDQGLSAPDFLAQHIRLAKPEDVPAEQFSIRAMVYVEEQVIPARIFCEADGTFTVEPTFATAVGEWQGDRSMREWQPWREVVVPGGEYEGGAMLWLETCSVFAYGQPEVQDLLAPWLAVRHGELRA